MTFSRTAHPPSIATSLPLPGVSKPALAMLPRVNLFLLVPEEGGRGANGRFVAGVLEGWDHGWKKWRARGGYVLFPKGGRELCLFADALS